MEYGPEDTEGRWEDKDEGCGRVLAHTPEGYKMLHNLAFLWFLEAGEIFAMEDLRVLCGDPPNHPNAYSALCGSELKWARDNGHLELLRHGFASRRSSHGRDTKFYRPINGYAKIPKGVEVEGFGAEEEDG